MKKNLSSTDRIIRISLSLLVLALYLLNIISGTIAIILGSIAIILALTTVISFCPLYRLFKISTKE